MPRIESLDSIRAVAVLGVVLFHTGFFSAGWVGVQIFFVLSGYLITAVLVDDKGATLRTYLAHFYWRRTLRIFPLYFAFLAIAACAFSASFAQDWPWLVTYTANFARLRDTDLAPPFVHLWSLAVEEQFYLIWPFAVFFLGRTALRKLVIAIILLAPLSRLALFLWFQHAPPFWVGKMIYSLPTSHADAFAAGAMLVLFKIKRPDRATLSLLAITAIAGAVVLIHQHLVYRSAMKWTFGYAMFLMQDGGFVWGYTLLDLTTAMAIASAIAFNPRLLKSAFFRRIGTISYGIYVYHFPLLLVLKSLNLATAVFLPTFLITTYSIAEMSFRYFETPFLRLKNRRFIRAAALEG
jgi:peptidoglycan/LPS O-acetylase OafA/YrhL